MTKDSEPSAPRWRTAVPALIALMCLLYGTPAFAHKVNVFATAEGRTIRGEVYFRGGAAVQNAKVEAFSPSGEKLGEATTDQVGKFSLEARYRCDYRLVSNAGEGHAGEFTVEAGELPDDLPAGGGGTTSPAGQRPAPLAAPGAAAPPTPSADDARLKEIIETAVGKQVGLLRRDLDRYQAQIRMRDVLGGIGYIVGITGLLFYFLGIRKKGRQIHE